MNQELNPTEQYIQELSQELWLGRASIMIGAGFSKNAEDGVPNKPVFPNWNQLGNAFLTRLGSKQNPPFANVLKIAEEYEAKFGRSGLHIFLKDQIPDKQYEPSQLHEDILKLPWVDVFTTNYETLLERAAEKVYHINYSTVDCCEMLSSTNKPRIIKLHGCFDNDNEKHKLIITEEDYRTYSQKYSPFVNTVQQSLIEDIMCLVGFSGNDPNFLSWIGWIRDHLPEVAKLNRIYIVGKLDNFSESQILLFKNKGIKVIDIMKIRPNVDHKKALQYFIGEVNNNKSLIDKTDWGITDYDYLGAILGKTISQFTNQLSDIRKRYPGWIVLPQENRNNILLCIKAMPNILNGFRDESEIDKLKLFYEYDWLRRKCLYPIYSRDMIELYKEYLKLLHLPEIISNKDWWLFELKLSGMGMYRMLGCADEWMNADQEFSEIKDFCSKEIEAWYHYEKCLFYLSCQDIKELRKSITQWPSDPTLFCWEVKRASLLFEQGLIDEAINIYEETLISIRYKLRDIKHVINYELLSIEAYVMMSLKFASESVTGKQSQLTIAEFTERWNTLKKYKCDPWDDRNYFRGRLQHFIDPGEIKNGSVFFGTDYSYNSLSYLILHEYIGLPYKMPGYGVDDSLVNALKYISTSNPFTALNGFTRIGDALNVVHVYNSKFINRLTQVNCDNYTQYYIEKIGDSLSETNINSEIINNHLIVSFLNTHLRILSLLSQKCSESVRLSIYEVYERVYLSAYINNIKDLHVYCKQIVNSLSFSQQQKIFEKLIPLDLRKSEGNDNMIDPFRYLNDNLFDKIRKRENSELISKLIEIVRTDSTKSLTALNRLLKLDDYKVLSNEHKMSIGNIVFINEKIDDSLERCVKSNMILYSGYVDKNKMHVLIKKYISSRMYNKLSCKVVNYHHFLNRVCEISGFGYEWNGENLSLLIDNIIEWWNNETRNLFNKEYYGVLLDYKEFLNQIQESLLKVFVNVVWSFNHLLLDSNKAIVKSMITELAKHSIAALPIEARFVNCFEANDLDARIKSALVSIHQNDIRYGFDAIYYLNEVDQERALALFEDCSGILYDTNIDCLSVKVNGLLQLLKSKPVLSIKSWDAIYTALAHAFSLSTIGEDDSNDVVNQKIQLKEICGRMSKFINDWKVEDKEEIPECIINWETECNDVNQFLDIRRTWNPEC